MCDLDTSASSACLPASTRTVSMAHSQLLPAQLQMMHRVTLATAYTGCRREDCILAAAPL